MRLRLAITVSVTWQRSPREAQPQGRASLSGDLSLICELRTSLPSWCDFVLCVRVASSCRKQDLPEDQPIRIYGAHVRPGDMPRSPRTRTVNPPAPRLGPHPSSAEAMSSPTS